MVSSMMKIEENAAVDGPVGREGGRTLAEIKAWPSADATARRMMAGRAAGRLASLPDVLGTAADDETPRGP
jgi:hypothetical protein